MTFISKNCSYYLTLKNQKDFLNYQTLSGFGFNKLGFYQQCIADEWNQFYLVRGESHLLGATDQACNAPFVSGICFNRTCSADDLVYALGSVFEYTEMPFSVISVKTPSLI